MPQVVADVLLPHLVPHPGVQADVLVPAPLHAQQGHAVQSECHHGSVEEVLAHETTEVPALAELDVVYAIDRALLVGLVVLQAAPPDLADRAIKGLSVR